MKKRIFASLLAICLLGTSVFAAAGDVIFEDGFEADYVDGLYISKPAIRAYGANLFSIGDFSTTPIKSADGTITYASNLKDAYDNPGGYIWQKDGTLVWNAYAGRTDAPSCYVKAGSTLADREVVMGIPVANMKADTIYELEMWVKNGLRSAGLKDAEDNYIPIPVPILSTVDEGVKFNSTATKTIDTAVVAAGLLNPNGNQQLFGVTSGDGEYTRMTGRFSINAEMLNRYKNNVDVHGQKYLPIKLNIGFRRTGVAAVTNQEQATYIYLDDISFREVLNAEVSTVDGQDGMPVYNDALIAGETANIVFDAVNKTGAAKDVTLIIAEYNADGSLKGILNQQVVTVGAGTARQHIVSADITMPTSVDGEIKVFAWDGTTLLTPYADAAGSEDTAYLTGSNRAHKYIAGSKVWKTFPRPNGADHDGYAYTDEIVSNVSSEGVNSLYIPAKTRFTVTPETGNSYEQEGHTQVYAGFDTEPGKRYQLTFDNMFNTNDTMSFALVGGAADSTMPATTMMSQPGTVTAPFTIQGASTLLPSSGGSAANGLEVYSIPISTFMMRWRSAPSNTTPWVPFTYTFTATAEKTWICFSAEINVGAKADDFALNAANTAVNANGGMRLRGRGAYVDNIKVVELAD